MEGRQANCSMKQSAHLRFQREIDWEFRIAVQSNIISKLIRKQVQNNLILLFWGKKRKR